MFIWEAGDTVQNILEVRLKLLHSQSSLKTGLLGLGQVLHDARPEKCVLGFLN